MRLICWKNWKWRKRNKIDECGLYDFFKKTFCPWLWKLNWLTDVWFRILLFDIGIIRYYSIFVGNLSEHYICTVVGSFRIEVRGPIVTKCTLNDKLWRRLEKWISTHQSFLRIEKFTTSLACRGHFSFFVILPILYVFIWRTNCKDLMKGAKQCGDKFRWKPYKVNGHYWNMKLSKEWVSVHVFQLIGLEEKTNRILFSLEFVNNVFCWLGCWGNVKL